LRKKGVAIWLLTTLTFIALIHLIDAAAALLFNSSTHILQLYPIINQQLQQIPITLYLYASAAATIALWAVTCLIAADNPVEEFLNKILSDAKSQTTTEAQILESKSEVLDLMYETIESDSEILAQVKDLMRNKGNNRENKKRNRQPEKANADIRGKTALHNSVPILRKTVAPRLQTLPVLR